MKCCWKHRSDKGVFFIFCCCFLSGIEVTCLLTFDVLYWPVMRWKCVHRLRPWKSRKTFASTDVCLHSWATSLFRGLINDGAADCTIWSIACSETPLSALLLLGTDASKCLIPEIADGYINTLIRKIWLVVWDHGLLARRSPHNSEQGFITMQISHSVTDSEPITAHSDMVICAVTLINRPILRLEETKRALWNSNVKKCIDPVD